MTHITDVTQICANIALIVGVVISLFQLKRLVDSNNIQTRAIQADHERREKQATIEFAHQILEERGKVGSKITEIFGNSTVDPGNEKYVSDADARAAVRRYLNLMERLAVGVNAGVFNQQIFARITGQNTINMFDRLRPIVNERRIATGRNTLYRDFEDLVDKMRSDYRTDNPLSSADIKYS